MKAEVAVHRDAAGRVTEVRYSAQCHYCRAAVRSSRQSEHAPRWIVLWLRYHKWWCRGYYFPKEGEGW